MHLFGLCKCPLFKQSIVKLGKEQPKTTNPVAHEVTFSQYQGKAASVAHHNPTRKWFLWGNIGPQRKATTNVCYLHGCEMGNSFPGFCLYFRHTYFLVHFVMAIYAKQTSRNLNLYLTTKNTIDASEKPVKNVTKKIPSWLCKMFSNKL